MDRGETIELTISYVTDLPGDDEVDKLRMILPTTIAPRYTPASQASGPFAAVSDTLAASGPANYQLTVDVHVQMAGNVTLIESPSHAIKVIKQE